MKLGIYLRVSDEDLQGEESNSIDGQREVLHGYIHKTEALSKCEILEFCDDGYSGTSFQRPAVQALLQKARAGEIHCILVKDFSRFGRNYIEVGTYVEQLFPNLGVRFISVNEHFDSGASQGEDTFISTAFQNLVYDLYSRDLSQKIISAKRAAAGAGKFVTAFAPYGYRKDKGQRLFIDEEAAFVVRRIFAAAAQDVSKTEIAEMLNRERVPSPLCLRKMRGEPFPSSFGGRTYFWNAVAISRILKDRRYVGDGVYGKTRRTAVGSIVEEKVPKEEWLLVPHAQEAIVSRDIFEAVNAQCKTYRRRRKTERYPLSKKVHCGVCKGRIPGKSVRAKNGEDVRVFYQCSTLACSKTCGCYGGKFEEMQLSNMILSVLNHFSIIAEGNRWKIEKKRQVQTEINGIQEFFIQQEKLQKNLNVTMLRLYERYRENGLNEKTFLEKKRKILHLTEKSKEEMEEKKKRLHLLYANFNKESYEENQNSFSAFTRKEAENFIDAVVIEQDGSIKVIVPFRDVFTKQGEAQE